MHTMQIDVPWSAYGQCTFFMPTVLRDWLYERGLRYSYVSKSSDGGGINAKTMYMVYKIHPSDATAFKIFFPECIVHHIEQPDYIY